MTSGTAMTPISPGTTEAMSHPGQLTWTPATAASREAMAFGAAPVKKMTETARLRL
jgi:hypothetical protein